MVIFSLLYLLLLSQLHHHHSRESSGLCAQTTLTKAYRHPASLDSSLNLIDREVALGTNQHCGIGAIRWFAQLVEQLSARYLLIAVGDILSALDRLLQKVVEVNHLVYLWFPSLVALLYGSSYDFVQTNQLYQAAL